MSTLFCNYCYEIKKPTIFFTHRDTTQKIDVSDIESADCMYMIIDDIKIEDLPFIDFLMGLCEKNDYSYFVIMGKHLCLDVAKSIDKLSSKRFSSALPKLVISLDLALENELFENAYVGTYVKEKEVLFAQPINAGMLKYIELKKIFHCADRLVEQIKKLNLSTIQQIIWIDNWFQENIQYIAGYETKGANGNKYICEQISASATVPDVFLYNYGVCEDIATSIAIILKKLNIPCEEVQGDSHAWLIVEVEKELYLWDCTRNITRNQYIAPNGIKATKYSHKYTLLGKDFCDKYVEFANLAQISAVGYSEEKIKEAVNLLSQMGVSFVYSPIAHYNSTICMESF